MQYQSFLSSTDCIVTFEFLIVNINKKEQFIPHFRSGGLLAQWDKAQYIGKYKGNQDFDIIINKYDCSIAFISEKDKYVPISSLFGKPKRFATDIRPVLAIFSKDKDQKEFKMQYLNSKVKLDKALFSKNTFDLLDITSFDNPKVKFNEAQKNALGHAFKATTRRYIQSDIKNIDSLKSHAFDSYDEMIEFSKACFLFEKSLDNKLKVDIATELLNERKEHVKEPEEYILIGSLGMSIEKAEKALNDEDSGDSGGQGVSRSPQLVTGTQKAQQKPIWEQRNRMVFFEQGIHFEDENQYKEEKETYQRESEPKEEVIFEEPKSGRGR